MKFPLLCFSFYYIIVGRVNSRRCKQHQATLNSEGKQRYDDDDDYNAGYLRERRLCSFISREYQTILFLREKYERPLPSIFSSPVHEANFPVKIFGPIFEDLIDQVG